MSSIYHFTHPGHPLTSTDGGLHQYLCNGCKTLGAGKRFRCHGCNFDLHEFCSSCPHTLHSFMHKQHALSLLMMRDEAGLICNVCRDPVAGLFYHCEQCGFFVHPLCTKLPEKLRNALHSAHALSLEFPRREGLCGVCRGVCDGWRYRCGICHFDIHIGCVSAPSSRTGPSKSRRFRLFSGGIPFQAPPQFANYYADGHPPGPGYSHQPGFYQGQNYAYPNNVNNNRMGRLGNMVFSLVQQLGLGAVSNMVFGVESPILFSG